MALEEYYKLLLRADAEEKAKAAKLRALEKRRATEASAAMRRRRREEAKSRRTEATATMEEAAAKAEAEKRLEAKVKEALAEADQADEAAEADAEAAAWAARRFTRKAKKRTQKGGWKINKEGFERLCVDADSGDLMFFDSVAVQVI